MTTPIPFDPAVGPLGTDYADGPTGFNRVAQRFEENLDRVNPWITKAESAYVSQPPELDANVLTPAAGWTFNTGYSGRGTYARKWGCFTFISMALKRTGATIAAGTQGNITDTLIGTLAPQWRPPHVQYVCGSFHSYAPCQLYFDTVGNIKIYAMSQDGQAFVTNRLVIASVCWVNKDTYFA